MKKAITCLALALTTVMSLTACTTKEVDRPKKETAVIEKETAKETAKKEVSKTEEVTAETTMEGDVIMTVLEKHPDALALDLTKAEAYLLTDADIGGYPTKIVAVISDTEQEIGDEPLWVDLNKDGKLEVSKYSTIEDTDDYMMYIRNPKNEPSKIHIFSMRNDDNIYENGQVYWANGEPLVLNTNSEEALKILEDSGIYLVTDEGRTGENFCIVIGKESFRNDEPTRERGFRLGVKKGALPEKIKYLNKDGDEIDFSTLPGVQSAAGSTVTFEDGETPKGLKGWVDWLYNVAELDSVSWTVGDFNFTAPITGSYTDSVNDDTLVPIE